MDYTELDIRLKNIDPYTDILVAKLNEINFESYVEDEGGVKAYIQTRLFDLDIAQEVIGEVNILTDLTFTVREVKQENWNALWEQNLQPVYINDKCVIRANFHNIYEKIEHEIIITPKMSFGTGHHETTFLMMNEMFNVDFKNKIVLDMGSGTGVLSILASKLGASKLVGVDSDRWAYENSLENASENKISNIKFIHGDSNSLTDEKFDVVLANINRNIIMQDIKKYVEMMHVHAEILLSGFLKDDVSFLLQRLNKNGLKLITSKNKNQWYMLHLRNF